MARDVPQIPLSTAKGYAYEAQINGSDAVARHGRCLAPYDAPLRGVEALLPIGLDAISNDPFVDYADGYGWLPGREPRPRDPKVRTVWVRAACRKCEECLKHKRRLWTARALSETKNALRTWFGTLTVSPERRFQAVLLAERSSLTRRCESIDAIPSAERTRLIAAQLAPEVTRWLKRVRQQTQAKLRYLLVVEAHKDGFPHFHLVLHETSSTQVSKRVLEGQWTYGFSSWRLVPAGEMRQVTYVCKYLTKSAQTRVRASRHYGQLKI